MIDRPLGPRQISPAILHILTSKLGKLGEFKSLACYKTIKPPKRGPFWWFSHKNSEVNQVSLTLMVLLG
jgi:hypothetical protein